MLPYVCACGAHGTICAILYHRPLLLLLLPVLLLFRLVAVIILYLVWLDWGHTTNYVLTRADRKHETMLSLSTNYICRSTKCLLYFCSCHSNKRNVYWLGRKPSACARRIYSSLNINFVHNSNFHNKTIGNNRHKSIFELGKVAGNRRSFVSQNTLRPHMWAIGKSLSWRCRNQTIILSRIQINSILRH